MAYETPSFEKYKMPIGGFGAAIQGAFSGAENVMNLRQKLDNMKTAELTRRKLGLDISQAEKMNPLELKAKLQAITREEQELPLDIQKKHAEINTELTKPDYFSSETDKNRSQSRLFNAEQQEKLIATRRGQQDLAILHDAYYNDGKGQEETSGVSAPVDNPAIPYSTNRLIATSSLNKTKPEITAQTSQSGQASQPQTSTVKAAPTLLSGLPPLNAQTSVATPIISQQSINDKSGLNLTPSQRRQLNYANAEAMLKGKVPPEIEMIAKNQQSILEQNLKIKGAGPEELQKKRADELVAQGGSLTMRATNAKKIVDNLNQFLKYSNAATIKGPIAGYFSTAAQWDPNYRAAQKAIAQSLISQLNDLGQSKLGRILQMEVEFLEKGTPDPNMTEEARMEIAKLLKVQSQETIMRSELFQKYKDLIPDAERLNMAIDNVIKQNNIVDASGNIHEESLNDIPKIATEGRMFAEAYPGKTDDKTLELIRNKSVRDAIPAPKGLEEDEIAKMQNKHGYSRRMVINSYNKVMSRRK